MTRAADTVTEARRTFFHLHTRATTTAHTIGKRRSPSTHAPATRGAPEQTA